MNTNEQALVQVGWAGRFPDKQMYLTKFDFEVRRWRQLGYPVWPVFTQGEPHSSDCATNNEPAMPSEPCDCGAHAADVAAQRIPAKIPHSHNAT